MRLLASHQFGSQIRIRSSKQLRGFEAFLDDGMGSFGQLNLDEQPSSQDLWQEILDDVENQNPVPSLISDDTNDTDGFRDVTDAHLENAMKREECADQTIACVANP